MTTTKDVISILMADDDDDDFLLTKKALAESKLANTLVRVSDGEDQARQTEVLVVEKVGQIHLREGCAVGLVRATGNPDANNEARRIADDRRAAGVVSPRMHGDEFADGAIVADGQRRAPALVTGILRRAAKHRLGIDDAVFADNRRSINNCGGRDV